MKRSDLKTYDMLRLIANMQARDHAERERYPDFWTYAQGLMSGELPSSPDVPELLWPIVPYKVALAKLVQMEKRHLVDYGVVITRPWLTAKGRKVLAAYEVAES